MKKINSINTYSNIKDYYYITTCGKVISTYNNQTRIMSPVINNSGYKIVGLRDNCGKRHTILIHRLVALAFIEENCDKVVNHKDENKINNCVLNLEFITQFENVNYGNGMKNRDNSNRKRRAIIQIFDDGTIVEWESASKASSELHIDRSLIVGACSGKYKKANKCKWEYKK